MHTKNCILLTIAKNLFISVNLLSGMVLNKGNKAQKKGVLDCQITLLDYQITYPPIRLLPRLDCQIPNKITLPA